MIKFLTKPNTDEELFNILNPLFDLFSYSILNHLNNVHYSNYDFRLKLKLFRNNSPIKIGDLK